MQLFYINKPMTQAMTINDFNRNFDENIERCMPTERPKTSSIVYDYEDILNHFFTTLKKLRMKY